MPRLEELTECIDRIFMFRHFTVDDDVRVRLLGIEIGEILPGICIRVYIFRLSGSFQCV